MNISQETWDDAITAIENAKELALACHQGPDGDALGSMLALQLGVTFEERLEF